MTSEREIPDWQLERYLLDELPADLREKISHRLESDPSLKKRLADLEESNRAILAQYPSRIQAAQITRKYEESYGKEKKQRGDSRRLMVRGFAYALSTVAVILIVLFPLRSILRDPPTDAEGIRLKGAGPRLVIYRKKGDDVERLGKGERAAEGDIIQLSYIAAGKEFGVIYSVDGRGVVTVHFPDREGESAPQLDQDGEISLPYAYELDDAPAFERFFFITSDRPFDSAEVESALRALASNERKLMKGKLKLPSRYKQYSSILIKEEY
jgi:hypothetical protein